MMNKHNLLVNLLIAFLATTHNHAQNLVPNHSFEDYTSTYCGILFSSQFDPILVDWVNPTLGSPQIFFTNIDDTCYNFQPFSQYNGPVGIKGNQLPRTGDVMLGLWSYTFPGTNQRQYAQVQLSNPMTAGNAYHVEFYASLADSMEFAIDQLGAFLSLDPISSMSNQPFSVIPQVSAVGPLDDITNWVLISDTIIPTENYEYLTIGNFMDDNGTNTYPNPASSGGQGTYGSFYFIDDIRVEKISLAENSSLQKNPFLVYPTQLMDELFIDVPSSAELLIHNTRGQLIYANKLESGITKIDVSNFDSGIYLVSISDGLTYWNQRVVK